MTADRDYTPTKTCKPCKACKETKQLEEFHRSPASYDGRASVCLVCTNAAKKNERRLANPEYYKFKLDLENGIRRCSKCKERMPFSSFYNKTASQCKFCQSKAGIEERLRTNPVLAARRQAESRGEILCLKCGVCKPATGEFFYQHMGKAKAPCKECRKKADYERNAKKSLERIAAKIAEPPPAYKACTDCGGSFPVGRKHFYKKLDGLTSQCKDCKNATDKFRREARSPEDLKKESTRRREWKKNRIKTDPLYALQSRIRALIYLKLKAMGYTKKSKTNEIIGCDWEFFKSHIERQFLKGMTWGKMGREIHIDHIVPLVTAKSEAEIIALNHFTNLRPLWAKENLSKSAQITHLI